MSGLLDRRRHGLSCCQRLLVDAIDRRQPLLERAAQLANYGRERDRWYASNEPGATDPTQQDELHRAESRAWHELRRDLGQAGVSLVASAAELDFAGLATIAALDLPDLKFPVPRSCVSFPFCDPQEDLFEELRVEDVLVHAPYEDFTRANAEFVARAVRDPQVVTIKLLTEGLADELPIIPDLARAAETGKQIVCLVRPNAERLETPAWRKRLERAGAYVLEHQYPLGRNASCALVVRREANEMRCYASIGDLHESPGSSFGLLTGRTACTRELVALFHALTSGSQPAGFSQLMVAPFGMRGPLRKLIRREAAHALAGEPAGITLQLTALEDPALCEELALAANAGVPIDVVVSATCLLAPSERKPGRIRVFAPAGWADEHTRLLYFRNRAADPVDGDFHLTSGDWTEQSLDSALELAIPLEHRRARERCWQSLELLRVDPDGWFLDRTGEWLQKNPESSGPIGARQRRLWRMAIDRLQRARNEEEDELQPIVPRVRPPWMLKSKRSRLADALRHMPRQRPEG